MKMKLNQSKLKLILLCALSVSALNVFADNKIITSSTIETGASYNDSDPNLAALNVTTNGVTYSGTNITLSATNNSDDLNAIGNGAYIDNAILSLTGGSITTSGSYGYAVSLLNASSGTLNNVTVQTTGVRGYGVFAGIDSILTMNGGSITTYATDARGAIRLDASSATVNDVNITTHGASQAAGIYMLHSALTLTGGTIYTTGTTGVGVQVGETSSATVNDVNIQTEGQNSYGFNVITSSTLTLDSGTISTTGTAGHGLASSGTSTSTLSNVNIQTQGERAHGVSMGSSSTLTLTDSDIRVTGSASHGLFVSGTGTITADLNGNTLSSTGTNGYSIFAGDFGTVTVTGSNGSVITGVVRSQTSGTVAITLNGAGTEMHGNFSQNGADSVITLTIGADALFEGGGSLDNLTMQDGAILGFTNTLLVADTISIGDNITIDFSSLTETGDYQVLNWTGAIITGGSISEDQFNIAGEGIEGTFSVANNQLTFNATAVPEPSTWFLIGAGLGALALIR
ncbi:MAG: PEP-CTERM sorting domain-containing protein, partial [Verrucomicrobiales bacterium]|nr:PEP-CTERM sorting domain-containing protein [Verrucomicrobiales bacterium]